MNPVKTDETLFVKLHNEWISNLYAYEEQLNQINTITRQLQSTVNDMQYQRELQQVESREEVVGEYDRRAGLGQLTLT